MKIINLGISDLQDWGLTSEHRPSDIYSSDVQDTERARQALWRKRTVFKIQTNEGA